MSSFVDSPSASDRSKLYKNNSKSDDSRRRRTECSIELRRQKRNDEMMKRRNLNLDVEESSENDTSTTSDPHDADATGKIPEAMTVQSAIAMLTSNPTLADLQKVFEGIRRLLSRSKDPPVQEVVKAGLVQALVHGLTIEDEKIQFEAAWALTNIVSGTAEETMAVIQAGATKPLINMCNSSSQRLAEQAIWAVANIAGDSTELRDHVIKEGLVEALKKAMNQLNSLSPSFVRTLAWTFSNLVRHKNPQLPYDILRELVSGIATLLKYQDMPVQQDSCWALSYLTDGTDQNIELAIQCNVIPDVVLFLASGKDSLIAPALRVLGNFATGNDDLTDIVVNCDVLNTVLPSLFHRANSSIVKESCWLASNVLAGTETQIQAVIDAGILPLLLNVLKHGDHRAQFEASWAIANLCHGGSIDQILEMLSIEGSIDSMCSALSVKNNQLISNMLESIYAVLKAVYTSAPDNMEKIQLLIEECNGLDRLENLQQHDSQIIYDLAYKIVDEFFNDDSDDNVEPVEPYDKPLDLTANTPFNF